MTPTTVNTTLIMSVAAVMIANCLSAGRAPHVPRFRDLLLGNGSASYPAKAVTTCSIAHLSLRPPSRLRPIGPLKSASSVGASGAIFGERIHLVWSRHHEQQADQRVNRHAHDSAGERSGLRSGDCHLQWSGD